MVKELDYTKLNNKCLGEDFTFNSTKDLTPLEGIIGQERAVKAFEFGLAVKMKGYNIYMAGPSGTGKTSYALSSAKKLAATESVPNDWCYVYNFKNPKKPNALKFDTGDGKKFKDDIAELVKAIKKELPKAFASEDYDAKKNEIVHEFDERQDVLMEKMNEVAKEYDFNIRTTNTGLTFIPVVNGEIVEEENFEKLTEEEKNEIDKKSVLVHEKLGAIMREIKELDKEAQKRLEELDRSIGDFAIGDNIEATKEKYTKYEKVATYLDALKKDVLENIEQFIEDDEDEEEGMSAIMSMFGKKPEEDVTLRYRVNLIVDHSETDGAPVVITFNPTNTNLLGEVEYDNEFGNLVTDFMKIKPGLFHQANGGYLIVQAHDILTMPGAWDALRRVIKTKEIDMDTSGSSQAPSLKPEAIPAKIKVIMVGSNDYYDLLMDCDEEFDKFFKIRADFDYEMERNSENIYKIAQFMKGFVERENTIEFDNSAICAVIKYSTRLTERQDKLSTRFNQLAEILGEAVTWAKMDEADIVSEKYIEKAVYEKEQRLKLYEEKLDEMYENNIMMIDTDGAEIGQINGLAVLDMGSYSFGNPTRITATTYVGKSGIVNIEKEARMSGHTHDKGVQIITGYLGQTYAQDMPLSLSCRVCFEQNYSGIDGDSASSTELYCILSSLSELPIRQDLAVTGSVNQKGEIQAIGGVNYKIEGFFDLCKKRGLTGNQGVIIPISNINELVLKDEVVEAVKEGKFHIYPISHINEGLELLTGELLEVIHKKAMEKLKKFDKAARRE